MHRLLLLSLFFSMSVVAETTVQVFVDGHLTIPHKPGVEITVYDMTAANKLVKRTPVFSPNRDTAKKQTAVWLKSKEGQIFLKAVSKAHQGTKAMADLKVKKIPAIVIDGTYVVYGSIDVDRALALYKQQKRQNP